MHDQSKIFYNPQNVNPGEDDSSQLEATAISPNQLQTAGRQAKT